MDSPILRQISKFLQDKKRYRRWLAVFTCLALIVGFGTVAALKMRGRAMTQDEKVLACHLEVHQHSEPCYDQEKNLICGYADYVVHVHNDDCYGKDGSLVCQLPQIETHTHTEECYQEQQALGCGKEETPGHTHGEECYAKEQGELSCQMEEHAHTEECRDADGALTCGLEEHTHTEDCYEQREVLSCQTEESEGHTHTAECNTVQKTLICQKPEVELHTHGDGCYERVLITPEGEEIIQDPQGNAGIAAEVLAGTADKDVPEGRIVCRRICGKLQVEEHVHGEGCFETQKAEEPGQEEPAYICGKEEHAHTEACYDENQTLICGQEEHAHTESCLEGQPETEGGQPAEAEDTNTTLSAEDADYIITVTAPKEAFPHVAGQLSLQVTRVEEGSEAYQKAQELVDGNAKEAKSKAPAEITVEEDGKQVPVDMGWGDGAAEPETEEDGASSGKHYIFDIKILENGQEVQPQVPVQVSFQKKTEDGQAVTEELGGDNSQVFHVDIEADSIEDMEAVSDGEGKTVIDTPHFSYYDLVVDEQPTGSEGTWDTLAANLYDGKYNNKSVTWTLNQDEVVNYKNEKSVIWLDNNRTLTIDLNGHSIKFRNWSTANGEPFILGNAGTAGRLIIKDSSISATSGLETGKMFLGSPGENASIGKIVNEGDGEFNLIRIKKSDTADTTSGSLEIQNGLLQNSKGRIIVCEYNKTPITITGGYFESKDMWAEFAEIVNNSAQNTMVDAVLKQDIDFTGTTMWLDSNRRLILDLNGHIIECKTNGNENNTMIRVGNTNGGGELVLKDSASASPERKGQIDRVDTGKSSTPDGAKPGNYDYETKKGTYYCTVSEPNSDQTGTHETTECHELDFQGVGAFQNKGVSGLESFIKIFQDGKVTVEGGRLSNAYGAAITTPWYSEGASGLDLQLKGGYLVGNGAVTQRDEGGAIFFEGSGQMALGEGVVIAVNKSANFGGGIRLKGFDSSKSITLSIDGAQICSNETTCETDNGAIGGGGIYAQDTKAEMKSGYISNNITRSYWNYSGGGGGICLMWSTLDMSGGFVTANESYLGGGGIRLNDAKPEDGVYGFVMTGGTVASNKSRAEGGGIRIAQGTGKIGGEVDTPAGSNRIFVTNNITTSAVQSPDGTVRTNDWGGGGIFIEDNNGILEVHRALLTENSAEGFGGGLGGCSTGRIFETIDTDVTVNVGSAIFGNTADGNRTSGGFSSKNEDRYAKVNPIFMGNGYSDVFSALGCYIDKYMLGGGIANWKGSCDDVPLDQRGMPDGEKGDVMSTKLLGLTSYPSPEDQEKAKGSAQAIITGNHSGTHGGGIMCNGVLILGNAKLAKFDDSLTINLQKEFKDESDQSSLTMNKGQFTFVLLDKGKLEEGETPNPDSLTIDENGNVLYKNSSEAVVAVAKNNETAAGSTENNIKFLLRYMIDGDKFDGEEILNNPSSDKHTVHKEYSYYLMEVPHTADADSVTSYDNSVYELDVNMAKSSKKIANYLDVFYLFIKSVTVTKDGSVIQQWNGESYDGNTGIGDYDGGTGHHGGNITISNDNGAAFRNTGKKPLEFRIRKTDGEDQLLSSVRFTLTELKNGKKTSHELVQLTGEDGVGEKGIVTFAVANRNGQYLLEETPLEKYEGAGPWIVEVEDGQIQIYEAVQNGDAYEKGKDVCQQTWNEKPIWQWQGQSLGNQLQVMNIPINYSLPETGGAGEKTVYAAALMLAAASALLGYRQIRRRKGEMGR